MSVHKEVKKITTHTLQVMKESGEKISMITAYDFSFAKLFDEAAIDIILVGDSASNVMAGHETTLPITLDQMIYHAQSVVRGIKRCLVVVDMPFGSYQGNSKEALNSAIRIMKETGGHSVKLEGGEEVVESVKRIVITGIPVMGHLGLTPQSIYKFGTYTVRAKEEAEAIKLKKDGDISEPFQTSFGIHILKRMSQSPAPLVKSDDNWLYDIKQKLQQDDRIKIAKDKFAKDIIAKIGFKLTNAVKAEDLYNFADSVMFDFEIPDAPTNKPIRKKYSSILPKEMLLEKIG